MFLRRAYKLLQFMFLSVTFSELIKAQYQQKRKFHQQYKGIILLVESCNNLPTCVCLIVVYF